MVVLLHLICVLFLTFANYHSISSIVFAFAPDYSGKLVVYNVVYGISLLISVVTVITWNIWIDSVIIGLGLLIYLVKGE